MKNKNSEQRTSSVAMKISAAIALPFKFLNHLFVTVIELMINVPVMNAVWRERRELELLFDDHIDEHIKDIGATSESIRQEMQRSYFDIPHDRKRSYKSAVTGNAVTGSAVTACYGKPI